MSVAPDYTEPIIGWRAWNVRDGVLLSLHQGTVPWNPGEPLSARCLVSGGTREVWTVTDVGDPAVIRDPAALIGEYVTARRNALVGGWFPPMPAPQTVLPPGKAWRLGHVTDPGHSAPAERCTCGIYASANMSDVLEISGVSGVWGRVRLWGRVVRHESGWRAQYAYPDRLYVFDKSLIPGLRAYGVPVEVCKRVRGGVTYPSPDPLPDPLLTARLWAWAAILGGFVLPNVLT